TLRDLQRSIHSLKGDSRSLGIETVEVLSQQVEEMISSLKRQEIALSFEVSSSLSQALNAIGLLVQEALTGQPSFVSTNHIIDELKAALRASQQPRLEVVDSNTVPIEEELRNVYRITSQERLQKLEAGLLHLEKRPNDAATLEELLREAHSLKGDSRSVGLETVEILIHQVEETLSGIKYQQITLTRDVSDRLFLELDSISRLILEAVNNQPSEVDTVHRLNHLIEAVIPTTEEYPLLAFESNSSLQIPLEAATQDLPSSTQEIGEPFRIDTIRVETRHLDALMTQAEELTVTKIAVAHGTAEVEELVTLWEESKAFYNRGRSPDSSSMVNNPLLERLEKIIYSLRTSTQESSTKLDIIAGELRDKIRTLRLLPLSTVFQLFPRVVRDLARLQSKEVELIIEGGETTADKSILEEIKDCLMHMIRNAIDHGIETNDEREKLGKPPMAKILVRSYQTGNNIIIEVADDGRGLDIETIKQTALKRRLYTGQELATMTSSQIYSLIFSPGFSTRTFITEISGRGIGLDVVRTNVERLKGSIQIESTPGEGCLFRIQLSPNLTTVNALLVEVQGVAHAIPIEFVQTTLLVSEDQISTTTEGTSIAFEGQDISVANLANLLELSNRKHLSDNTNKRQKSNLQPCVLLKVGLEQAGFLVDHLLDTQEVFIKPQSQLLKRVRNVMGATILPTGEVCMILNPPDLLHSRQLQTPSFVSIKPKEIPSKPVILLVEDSPPVRTQEKRLLERAGYDVVIAVDGLDGYTKLKTSHFDAVLTDVEMPNLDGFSLTAKIRQHPEYKNLPIIIVTTLASEEDKKRGAEVGADAYIIKGKFNENALLEILARLV
ncbi:MAG: hybrid sensor histidine kinase/response regulator, partial [Rhizonema sp. NSF051]|nr:hybrid sensor histidine kinase/response regulator [Rhizonema sp. NSF051]